MLGRICAAIAVCWPLSLAAQDDRQTLADIRQELVILNVELQQLRRELSTTAPAMGTGFGLGADSAALSGSGATGTAQPVVTGGVLDRLNTIEAELQRVIGQTEELEFRIERIVVDGTNRIGDLEFRLLELAGGDFSELGETLPLGGDMASADLPPAPPPAAPENGLLPALGDAQLADQERADFERAAAALAAGDFVTAVDKFIVFNETYPGGPLAPAADLARGDALDKMGDIRAASKAYLAAFSADQTGATAPQALFRLGTGLSRLGKTNEACVMLAEVTVRFAESAEASAAEAEMQALGCV